jgi:hypothetical protein
MHQALGIVMIVLITLMIVVIGLFCGFVIEEERSKMRNGGGEATPLDGKTDEELLGHERKSVTCC